MTENLGTRIAAPDQTLLAVFRSDANGCSVALCQRRQPPKAGAVGQRLQRVAGQSSWTIKNDGWFRIAQVRLTRERPYAKTVRFSKRVIAVYVRILAAANTSSVTLYGVAERTIEHQGGSAIVRAVNLKIARFLSCTRCRRCSRTRSSGRRLRGQG